MFLDYKRIVFIGLGALSLASCNNQNLDADLPAETMSIDKIEVTAGIEPVQTIKYRRVKDQARALTALGIPGGQAVEMFFTYPDGAERKELTVRWVSMGKQANGSIDIQAVDIKNKHTKAYNPGNDMGTGYTILNDSNTPVNQGKKLYVSYEDNTGKDSGNKKLANIFKQNQFAYLVVGGLVNDYSHTTGNLQHAWGYGNASRGADYQTNLTDQKLYLISDGTKMDISFPLMTQAIPLTVRERQNSSDKRVATINSPSFKPRGLLFAFTLDNEMYINGENNGVYERRKMKALSIETVVGWRTNFVTGAREHVPCPWSFAGYFDASKIDFNNNNAQDIPYINTWDQNRPYNFPLYASPTATERGIVFNDQTFNGKRFVLWGYPTEANRHQNLFLRVEYQLYSVANPNQLEPQVYKSAILAIRPTTAGWQEGKVYATNLRISAYTEHISDVAEFEGYINGGGYQKRPDNKNRRVKHINDLSKETNNRQPIR